VKGKQILLVDDDEALVNTYRDILRREGYHVEAAFTGKEALDKVKHQRFDLVILDIVLPDIRGDMVASAIRRDDDSVGLIFITGYPSFQDCIDALDIGIHEILLKPIAPRELLEATRELLKNDS